MLKNLIFNSLLHTSNKYFRMDINTTTTSSYLDINISYDVLIPLGVYGLVATILGVFGNMLVLYSSIRYNALNVDKVTLMFAW